MKSQFTARYKALVAAAQHLHLPDNGSLLKARQKQLNKVKSILLYGTLLPGMSNDWLTAGLLHSGHAEFENGCGLIPNMGLINLGGLPAAYRIQGPGHFLFGRGLKVTGAAKMLLDLFEGVPKMYNTIQATGWSVHSELLEEGAEAVSEYLQDRLQDPLDVGYILYAGPSLHAVCKVMTYSEEAEGGDILHAYSEKNADRRLVRATMRHAMGPRNLYTLEYPHGVPAL